jgi:hypothetical protein
MFRNSRRKLAGLLNPTINDTSGNRPGRNACKSNRKTRTVRKLLAEQLEARNLFAGLTFDSVISTESNWPIGKSYGYAVAADAAGNSYVGGFFEGIADFDRNASYPDNSDILTARGTGDAYLAKYSPSGQFLWARRTGGDSTTSVFIFGDDKVESIAIDGSGNVFVTGFFAGNADFGNDSLTSGGATDTFLSKVDTNGNFIWTKQWGTAGGDRGIKVVVDANGSASVLSNSSDVILLGKIIASDVRQFDANGNLSWISDVAAGRTYNSLTNDASGNLYVGGGFRGTVDLDPGLGQTMVNGLSTENNQFISKISEEGTLQWATRFVANTSVNTSLIAYGTNIAVGNDGVIALSGMYRGDVQIIDGNNASSLPFNATDRSFFLTLNPSTGNRNFLRVYEADLRFRSLISTKDGYTTTGSTVANSVFNPVPGISLASKGNEDIWIMTLDQGGSVSWAGLVGGENLDFSTRTSSDGNGGVLLTGITGSTVFDFDPNPNRTYNVSRPASFVLKLKPTPPTKFYVVDDATINRTYEYSSESISVDEYSLNSGNSAPRGAASTVAGDKVWVVDANKRIYVYNNSGVLLGSWTAGSLASNATIEGITTNGTDVWLVDARQDRVFRYANAASRLSGSQNATSSFALNSGNTSPKDLVTDGASLWVVNDSTTDRVFKYSMTGALVGSWTIDSANKAPTGLTIDPSGTSQSIWIVDNGTDRVYEYSNSRSRNSGSQSASLSFALAAGNTNPQGIADPPAPTFTGMSSDSSTQEISSGMEAKSDQSTISVKTHQHSMAAVDQAFANSESFLEDDEYESLWSRRKTSIQGRRSR